MNTHDLVRQLAGWRQTTAEILYRMPDHPALVQTYVWQDMDRWHDDPRLTNPRLRRFCEWWNANLDGPIVQVRVGAIQTVTFRDQNTSIRRCAFIEAALSSEHGGRRSGFVALECFSKVLSSVSDAERGVPSPRGNGADPNRGCGADGRRSGQQKAPIQRGRVAQ
jgi:uncharacterized protein Usg